MILVYHIGIMSYSSLKFPSINNGKVILINLPTLSEEICKKLIKTFYTIRKEANHNFTILKILLKFMK